MLVLTSEGKCITPFDISTKGEKNPFDISTCKAKYFYHSLYINFCSGKS